MIAFSIHFLFCNILISGIVGAILLVKKILGKHLSGCGQYHIWFLLPVILTVPFLSIRPAGLSQIGSWFHFMQSSLLPETNTTAPPAVSIQPTTTEWMNDFRLFVTRDSASIASYIPFVIWTVGMIAMTLLLFVRRLLS